MASGPKGVKDLRRFGATRLAGSILADAESEQRLRVSAEILAHTSDAIAVLDASGRILEQNAAHRSLFGYSDEDLRGQTPAVILGDEVFSRFWQEVARFGAYRGELLGRSHAGTPMTVDLSAITMHDETGNIDGYVVLMRDVTAHRTLERELMLREKRLKSFFTSAPAGLAIVDAQLRYREINEMLARTHGRSVEDHVGKTVSEVLPELASTIEPILQRVLTTGQPAVNFKTNGRTPSQPGIIRDWVASYFPLEGPEGKPDSVGAIVVEVTERKRAEEKFERLMESISDALVTVDQEGRIVLVNAQSETLFGYKREELLGQPVEIVLPEHRRAKDREYCGAWMTSPVAQPMRESVEVYGRRKDGREFPVEVSFSRSETENGLLVTSLIRDITRRRQAEDTIRSLLQFAEKLNSTLDVDVLLDSLVMEAIKLVHAEGGCAGIRGPDGMVCRKYFRRGVAIPWEYTFAPGEGLPGWLIVHKVPYLINDARADKQVIPEVRELLGFWSAISTPLLDGAGDTIGFFEIHNKADGSGFTPSDQATLVAVSQAASAAVQNALAYRKLEHVEEAMRQLSGRLIRLQDEERRRIARELHDTTAQVLAALVMNLDAVKKSSRTLGSAARKALDESTVLAKQASQEVRTLSYLLHPPMMDEFGLAPAIGWFIRGFSQRSGMTVDLKMPSQLGRLPQEVEATMFRILQEALTNVHRHTRTKKVAVRVSRRPHDIVLEVKDRGRGVPLRVMNAMERGSGDGLGVGIPGMRERAELVSGQVKIESTRRGTIVTAILPLPDRP